MVEVSLESYILADSPKYTEFNIIDIPYVSPPHLSNTSIYHGMGSTVFFDNLEEQYGIKFKYLWGHNDSGSYTQAYITNWDDNFLYVHVWSNQPPLGGSQVKLTLVRATPYVSSSPAETLSCGEYLVDNTLTITQQFESLKKMDLRVSTSTFELIGFDALKIFMGKYWTAGTYPVVDGYYRAMGVHIKEDGVGKFFGYIRPENIIYDPELNIYSIDAFDWMKFLFESKGKNYLPDYPTPNLSEFISDNLVVFNSIQINANGISETWNQRDYNFIYIDGVLYSIEHLMTVEDMFVEIIKHYCGYIYYDGDKNLVFNHRAVYQSPDGDSIDSNIISGTLSESYVIKDYDSLLINVYGDWLGVNGVGGTYNGWALVWWEDDELQSLSVNADLSNIPAERNYLDLRQKIPFEDFRYRLFEERDRNKIYNDYAYLLSHRRQYSLEVNRTDLALSDLVKVADTEYIIRNIEIIPSEHKSVLLMEAKIGN